MPNLGYDIVGPLFILLIAVLFFLPTAQVLLERFVRSFFPSNEAPQSKHLYRRASKGWSIGWVKLL